MQKRTQDPQYHIDEQSEIKKENNTHDKILNTINMNQKQIKKLCNKEDKMPNIK